MECPTLQQHQSRVVVAVVVVVVVVAVAARSPVKLSLGCHLYRGLLVSPRLRRLRFAVLTCRLLNIGSTPELLPITDALD